MLEVAPLLRRAALPSISGEGGARVAPGAVGISVLPPRTRLSLRLAPAAAAQVAEAAGFTLDLPINRCMGNAERTALRLGPDEWLLRDREAEAAALVRGVEAALAGVPHSLVDVSHGYLAFAVTGPAAAEAIGAGCPLDLWPDVFQPGHATRTLLGKAEIILARPGDAQDFEIECARSLAAYVRDFLLEASRGLGGPPQRA